MKKLINTKFLGVILDDELNWKEHIEYLNKKLRSVIGAICRIRQSVPSDYYKCLYSALFNSHLSYGVSIWGGAHNALIDKLFITQKHCIRVLFGDFDAYLDKQSTCARAREFGRQKLGSSFYSKEHTKPIFNRLKLMTIHHMYYYFSVIELYKILKYRTPYSLYIHTNISPRDTSNAIILSQFQQSDTFLYQSSVLWNSIHKSLINFEDSFANSMSLVKNLLKVLVLKNQSLHDENNWTDDNFMLKPPEATYTSVIDSILAKNLNPPHQIVIVD